MNHVDSWQALTIWQSGMLWHGNWWKLPFAGRSSSIGDHDDNCLFDLGLKQLCPLTSPLSSKHLIGIPWQMHVPQCPSGIPCPINWWKWQLPRQSSPIVRLNFAKVYFLCRALYILQLCVPLTTMTNKNKFKWLLQGVRHRLHPILVEPVEGGEKYISVASRAQHGEILIIISVVKYFSSCWLWLLWLLWWIIMKWDHIARSQNSPKYKQEQILFPRCEDTSTAGRVWERLMAVFVGIWNRRMMISVIKWWQHQWRWRWFIWSWSLLSGPWGVNRWWTWPGNAWPS